MTWNEYDKRLKMLWNHIATAYSDTVSYETSCKAEREACKLMEELTNELKK
ncbi:hypothetical protein [Clostridium sp.]|uniref:hypothetical protein n=1 Tax=Clostridium sp. TaxID=1506 RepID=UPI001D95713E|nr:hypothetical protein [Clostridium sp.]MBS5307687.1 hypothetical protein [Clostridium sp.]